MRIPKGITREESDLRLRAELAGIVVAVFGLDNRKMVKRRPLRKRPTSLDVAQVLRRTGAGFICGAGVDLCFS